MKKMRFKKRAALALTLAAVMTLGTVMPVWADNVTTGATANTDRDVFNGTTGSAIPGANTVVIDVNVPSAFSVQIPKEVTMKKVIDQNDYSSDQALPNEAVRYEAGKLRERITVQMSGSLGTDQIVTISSKDFNMKNRFGRGTNNKTHKMTVTALTPPTSNTNTSIENTSSGDPGFVVSGVGNNGPYWGNSYQGIGTWNITNFDTVGAGHWAGPMEFTISVHEENDP